MCFVICHLTHQPTVVSAVVEEQLLFWVDLCGGTEKQLPIGRVRYKVLFLTGPKKIVLQYIVYTAIHREMYENFYVVIIPCFADEHHPVAFIFVCCHNVEFQHVVVIHLK